jgi:F420H(2)-dependent quinone reductase
VQIGKRCVHVTARLTEGDERAALWSAMTNLYHGFDDYAANTDREIPVFALTPTGDHGEGRPFP